MPDGFMESTQCYHDAHETSMRAPTNESHSRKSLRESSASSVKVERSESRPTGMVGGLMGLSEVQHLGNMLSTPKRNTLEHDDSNCTYI
jgi:hypothetical protein